MITSGELNKPISVLQRSTTRDAAGGQIEQWNLIANTWGSIDYQTSSLLYEPSVFVSKVLYRIKLRYRTDISFNAATRIQYLEPTTNITHTYEVQGVLNTKAANTELILMCYELDGSE